MALTPDQKKRIAALDQGAVEQHEEKSRAPGLLSSKVKSTVLKARASSLQAIVIKLLIIAAIAAGVGYFVVINQIHRIDFKGALASGRGSPITKISNALKLQKQKGELLEKGHGLLLAEDYTGAFQIALTVEKLDPNDSRHQVLIDDTAGALARRALLEMDSGDIESALKNVRLALKYMPNHHLANGLYADIGDRLLLEAQAHYNKAEYPTMITKAQEVVRIGKSPSNMSAYTLLGKTSNELLGEAEELYASKRYSESLEKVSLSLKIDSSMKTNATAHGLFERISTYVGFPEMELRGIIRRGRAIYAQIYLPKAGKVNIVKKGELVKGTSVRIIDIDTRMKKVTLKQINTGDVSTIQQSKPK
jgi:tetratricopeptide (TPR) repeat protein